MSLCAAQEPVFFFLDWTAVYVRACMYVCVRAYVRVCESFTDTGLSGVYPVSCLPSGQEFTKVCVCVCVCVCVAGSLCCHGYSHRYQA